MLGELGAADALIAPGPDGAAVPVPHEAGWRAGAVRLRRHRRRHRSSVSAAMRAVEAHRDPVRSAAPASGFRDLRSTVRCGPSIQDESGVHVTVERNGRSETHSGRWLIGADGARSDVRRSLGIAFEGFTWPERFLVVSTPFDFYRVIPGLVSVSYVADPERWHFLLQIPGLWRVMFPIAAARKRRACLVARVRAGADGDGGARHCATTRSRTPRSTRCISGWRRRSGSAARSWSAMPRTSTIRSAAWG